MVPPPRPTCSPQPINRHLSCSARGRAAASHGTSLWFRLLKSFVVPALDPMDTLGHTLTRIPCRRSNVLGRRGGQLQHRAPQSSLSPASHSRSSRAGLLIVPTPRLSARALSHLLFQALWPTRCSTSSSPSPHSRCRSQHAALSRWSRRRCRRTPWQQPATSVCASRRSDGP
jgi:hypothetical protein